MYHKNVANSWEKLLDVETHCNRFTDNDIPFKQTKSTTEFFAAENTLQEQYICCH